LLAVAASAAATQVTGGVCDQPATHGDYSDFSFSVL